MLRWGIILLLSCSLISCNVILGIKKPKPLSEKELKNFKKKINLDSIPIIRIDTTAFFKTFNHINYSDSKEFNDLIQPIQIIVYDQNKKNIAHFINCNIGGIPLKWNRTKSFDHYPLQLNGLQNATYNLQFEELNSYLQPAFSDEDIDKMFEEYDHIYVVIYNYFIHKLSKSMYRNLNAHKKKFASERIKYIYVFFDDVHVELGKRVQETENN